MAPVHPRPYGVRMAGYGPDLVGEFVKMGADIRVARIELDAMGMIVENKCGIPIPNPLLSVIDTLERRRLAVIRSMSLNQTASDPRTINGSAEVEVKARAALKLSLIHI